MSSSSTSDDKTNVEGLEVLEDTSESYGAGFAQEDEGNDVDKARQVAQRETRRLRFWRFVVMDTIIMIATVLILTTYTINREGEHVKFQEAFTEYANILTDRVVEQQKVLRATMQEFSATVSSTADATGAYWPFFTMPNFEGHADKIKSIAGVQALGLFSEVDQDQRPLWVVYANRSHESVVRNGNRLAGTEEELRPVGYHSFISRIDAENGDFILDSQRETYFPSLAWSPPPLTYEAVNWNMASDSGFRDTIHALKNLQDRDEVLYTFPQATDPLYAADASEEDSEPLTYVFAPVLRANDFVGVVSSAFAWNRVFSHISIPGVVAIVKSSCGQVFSYEIKGQEATFLGPEDLHDSDFDKYLVEIDLSSLYSQPSIALNTTGHCLFDLEIYPTSLLWDEYVSFKPETYAIVVALLFFVIAAIYFVYDKLVDKRNEKLVARFAKSNAIVSSLFPQEYQERLMGGDDTDDSKRSGKGSLKQFMSSGMTGSHANNTASKPLADLFPDVSILFSDIAGFTAWSSVREPNQVFLLLETLYSAFDEIATARGIFKVETVGDCYVAAAGLPEARRDHAVALVRFAKDILLRMQVLTKELEIELGPDTGDLSLRTGIHSGPVTAGILRGKKARFQLFGDSMNTCARIETTGLPGRIHLSQATANLLCQAGKSQWVRERPELVTAKGKGTLQTYWLTLGVGGKDAESTTSGSSGHQEGAIPGTKNAKRALSRGNALNFGQKVDRLVEWNLGALMKILKEIVARRDAQTAVVAHELPAPATDEPLSDDDQKLSSHKLPLDEVKEIIYLPDFNKAAAQRQRKPEQIEIPSQVVDQLRMLVRKIASLYHDNHFHNFDHASHVTMSVIKLMSRIVAPQLDDDDTESSDAGVAATLHDHTYGITSDPLTQFACVFSALIHDLDHFGVPNAQLVKEGHPLAAKYVRSVAEQNSFDLGWSLFMDSSFDAFRATICSTPAELSRFRELVICCVMATDICDKELKEQRNDRWQKAFDQSKTKEGTLGLESSEEAIRSSTNRKATIVIEHLMQASDVSHTMQHWHIYRKWNELFFRECFLAYKQGRAALNPTDYWYKGEIGFFDFYIIPLAKKLKDCGVFGVSSDEYLIYAQNNRDEWEARGEGVVAELVEKAERDFEHSLMAAPSNEGLSESIKRGASRGDGSVDV